MQKQMQVFVEWKIFKVLNGRILKINCLTNNLKEILKIKKKTIKGRI